ncbi:MAG: acyl-CoA dehydrogenase, partial [Anaerolineae bacterium]|nr:acyl-CoA dehydrogenase [Anaerolineae bacterium]
RVLAQVLERCRTDRLTRHQHILFRLGEWIAFAEGAAVFAERVCDKPTEAVPLSVSSRQALARIYAREAALKVADGLRWIVGADATDAELFQRLPALYQAQSGNIADMDAAAEALTAAFKKE